MNDHVAKLAQILWRRSVARARPILRAHETTASERIRRQSMKRTTTRASRPSETRETHPRRAGALECARNDSRSTIHAHRHHTTVHARRALASHRAPRASSRDRITHLASLSLHARHAVVRARASMWRRIDAMRKTSRIGARGTSRRRRTTRQRRDAHGRARTTHIARRVTRLRDLASGRTRVYDAREREREQGSRVRVDADARASRCEG